MTIWHLFLLIMLAAIYLIPAIIAFDRRHRQRGAILALNILLGWTFIGWLASFVWSLTNSQTQVIIANQAGGSLAFATPPDQHDRFQLRAGHVIALLMIFGFGLAVLISTI